MRRSGSVVLVGVMLGAVTAWSAPQAERPKLLVLDLTAAGAVDPGLARTLTDAVTAEAGRSGYFQVMSTQDVQTLVGVERQRQLMGCSEESGSCLAELAGAMGAQLTLSGSIGRLGDAYQLTLQTLDAERSQPVGRTTKLAKTPEGLRAALPWAVAEATGTPIPPPPSRTVPYALIGAGSAALVGSGLLGFQALSADGALNRELSIAKTSGVATRSYAEVQGDRATIGVQRTVSLVGLVAGAALIGSGVWLLPSSGDAGGVALLPTTNGVALAGVFR